MLQNKPFWLGLVLLLAGIKFVLLPLIQLQQDNYNELEGLSKRVQRSEALLADKDQLQQWQVTQQQQQQQLMLPFPVVDGATQYRLVLQQQLQQLAAENGVSVTFFDWLTDTPLQVFNLQRGRLSWRVEGDASQIMQLHVQLEQQFPHFILRDVKASWRGDLNPGSRIELNLLIEVDYKLQEQA